MTEEETKNRLKSIIERVERLEEEKRGLSADIKEIYSEAKSGGFDTKAIKAIVKLRRMDDQARRELEELIDLYKGAVGIL